jgi:ABC-type nitrate/sulfonate/bicarbonate transport system substrate-binding protein
MVALVAPGCNSGTGAARSITYAYQDRVVDAASIIAVTSGFFADESLDVTPLRFSSGPACSESLYTGACDVATMGDSTAVIAAARGAPIRLLASHGGGEHRIIVAAGSPAKVPGDLVGLRVAVKRGTSTYGGFLAFLDTHAIDRSRVEVVDLRPFEMLQALSAGSVQAIVASEPTPSLALEQGGRQLATLGGLCNSYPILVVANQELVTNRPEDAIRLLRGPGPCRCLHQRGTGAGCGRSCRGNRASGHDRTQSHGPPQLSRCLSPDSHRMVPDPGVSLPAPAGTPEIRAVSPTLPMNAT